jgi:dihydropteroate synthase
MRTLNCRGRLLVWDRPLVMGIINLTPDSFHDGGTLGSTDAAVDRAGTMLEQGASILDIGAYSSRPGATDISPDEECERLLPPLEAIRSAFPEAFLSVDTFRSDVASAALECGAGIINDISGGMLDAELPRVAAKANAPYIAMNMRGTPQTMQQDLAEGSILGDMLRFFGEKIPGLRKQGLRDIIIDPGFGFGKTLAQNYELAGNLGAFKIFGCPILVGVSRKSMVNKVLGTGPATALNGTTALHALLLGNGADILRVHDVREAVEAVEVFLAVNDREGSPRHSS